MARYCARSFGLPVTIARMGAAYGDTGGLPAWNLDAVAAGQPVLARWDPLPYAPIHDDDICAQLEPLIDAATVPATIVNWGGDEPVSVQEWSAYFGELLGVGRGRRAAHSGSVASGRSPTSPSARRSPGRAASVGGTASAASPSTSIPSVVRSDG